MELAAVTNASSILAPIGYVLPTLACLFSSIRNKDGVRNYEGYKIFRVNANSPKTFDILVKLMNGDNYDFLTRPSMIAPTDIMVCPEQVTNVKFLFKLLGIPYDIKVENLKREIEEEKSSLLVRQSNSMSWDTYHRLSTIQSWMEYQATQYPFVTVETIGTSSEGRPLKLLKISTGGAENKPSIWMDGGIHAREWISPAVVTYIANDLIQSTFQNPDFKLTKVFDWYILPNVNPDGYEFSHSSERMWRKTRSQATENGWFANFFKCKGADPNRNFEYQWGGKGTSKNPCSDIYKGSKAASEPEIDAVQRYVLSKRESLKLFLTFHSYSQMLFLPWGYDNVRVPDHDELMVVATKAAKVLESYYGTKYEVGPSPELLYAAAGGSEDFAKGIAGIKYSYCFELRDTGSHGFTLPSDQIIPSGVETLAAVNSMAEDMIQIYQLDASPSPPETIPETKPETGDQV